MLEIVVRKVDGSSLQVSQNSFRMLDSEVSKEAAPTFPEFEVGPLEQLLHQGPRRLAPQRSRANNGEADGPSYPANELAVVTIPQLCAK